MKFVSKTFFKSVPVAKGLIEPLKARETCARAWGVTQAKAGKICHPPPKNSEEWL
jgi:hypothetical protein